jgi:anthranilate synthase component 1
MSDPWEEFQRRAGSWSGESAVYFERRPSPRFDSGVAQWAFGREPARSISHRSSWEELSRDLPRYLKYGRRRALAGYIGFDAVGIIEPLLRIAPSGSPFPLGMIAEFDHVMRRRFAHPPRRRRIAGKVVDPPREDTLSRRAYEHSVTHLISQIRAGEAFQVVLSHRRGWRRPEDLLERAGRLRAAEPSSYFYYLRLGNHEIVGASPEAVVELERGRAAVHPIAGTRPRRRTGPARLPLAQDPKELSEHRMLVDLARNDLGTIALPGSVRLRWTERELKLARVEHLVSRVEARLCRGVGPLEALAATFPAGTVSGAPKIRATQLLRAEEKSWRGPYAGAVGWISAPDCAHWALAIRTAFAAGDRIYTAAGAGIVHRSRPRREYDETLAKLSAVESALIGGG